MSRFKAVNIASRDWGIALSTLHEKGGFPQQVGLTGGPIHPFDLTKHGSIKLGFSLYIAGNIQNAHKACRITYD